MTRSAGEYHIFASMSGMLDLSRDEKAKHFLPRWLREVVVAKGGVFNGQRRLDNGMFGC